jgi:hypothetical protein
MSIRILTSVFTTKMPVRPPLKVATQGHNLMKVNTAGRAREKAEDHRVK